MFERQIGIDLGTVNVLVYVSGRGIVLREPSVVAISIRDNKIVAVGQEARDMLGRTPESIEVARPMRDGVIADYVVTEAMLRYFIRKVVGRNPLFRPQVMISTPKGVTSVESRAVHDAAMQAGAKEAYLIPEPLAAAYGAGLPIGTPTGNMVVDIGGGTTEAAVVSMNDIVVWSSVRVGGIRTDEAIMAYVRKKYNLIIGEQTAEEIKIQHRQRAAAGRGTEHGSARPRPGGRAAQDHHPHLRRDHRGDRRAARRHHRRRPADAGEDPARAGRRYHRPRHGAERRRRAAAQHRPAGDQGNRRARASSPSTRWPAWRSARAGRWRTT